MKGDNAGRKPLLTIEQRAGIRARIEATRVLRAKCRNAGMKWVGESYDDLAEEFGVCRSTIQDIAGSREYKNLNPLDERSNEVPRGTSSNNPENRP